MTARHPHGLCAAGLAVLMLAAPAAQAQITPEAQLRQAEAMGLCDPTLAPGVRLPNRLVGCTPQQAAAMGIPPGAATGASGSSGSAGGGTAAPRGRGGLMGGAGPGGVQVGGDPFNMGAPRLGPKPLGAPKAPGGGPLGGPMAGGPRPPSPTPGPGAPTLRDGSAISGMPTADADKVYNGLAADVLEAIQADKDMAQASAADRKRMAAEVKALTAQREASKTAALDEAWKRYERCEADRERQYREDMQVIPVQYAAYMKAAKDAAGVAMAKKWKVDATAQAEHDRKHRCVDIMPNDKSLLAPLPPGK